MKEKFKSIRNYSAILENGLVAEFFRLNLRILFFVFLDIEISIDTGKYHG